MGSEVDIVDSYNYLEVHIDNKLDWSKNTDADYTKKISVTCTFSGDLGPLILQCSLHCSFPYSPVDLFHQYFITFSHGYSSIPESVTYISTFPTLALYTYHLVFLSVFHTVFPTAQCSTQYQSALYQMS